MKSKNSSHQRLRPYREKRRFGATREPTGRGPARIEKSTQLLFCVQKHLAGRLHYDFRLEHKGVLLSWAIPKGPSLNTRDRRLAVRVEDHPLDYGDFEGVIPEGYGAGIVMLWDRGTWTPETGDVQRALADGTLKFSLNGTKLKGNWVLTRSTRDEQTWFLIKRTDEWAGDVDVTAFAPRSIKSDEDFEGILALEDPALWTSHRPQGTLKVNPMLREVIQKAALLKANAASSSPRKTSGKSSTRTRG